MIRKIIREIIEESLHGFLNEKIGDYNYNKTFQVPTEVINICKQAIQKTGSSLEKAVELSQGIPQTFNQIKKLRDYFSQNSNNKDDNWQLHGGDACQVWIERELSKFHDENQRTKDNIHIAGGAGDKKGLGIFDTNPLDTTRGKNNIR